MSYDLANLELTGMTRLGAELRRVGQDAPSMEAAAQRIVRLLYDGMLEPESSARSCALVRFYQTLPYAQLSIDLQAFANKVAGADPPTEATRCLTLLATAGVLDSWDSRFKSSGHKSIPLVSEEMIARLPMVSQLLVQLGLDVAKIVDPDAKLVMESEQESCNVFYVHDAVGSPYIPAQEDFVIPYGIRSVLGFGGVLSSGEVFAVLMFATTMVSKVTADIFRNAAMNVKAAIAPFSDGPILTPATPRSFITAEPDSELRRLRSQLTTLEEVLAVQERTVIEQTGKLNSSMQQAVHLASIVEASPDAIVSATLDNKVESWNKGAEQMFGYSEQEAIGMPLERIVPSERAAEFAQRHEVIRRGDSNLAFDTVRMKKDGERFPVSIYGFPIKDGDGRIVAWAGVFRDLTERKKLEERLQRVRKMEAVGELAGGLAHEFNNALTVVLGRTQSILRRPIDADAVCNNAERIEAGANRIALLIRQLLAFSRTGMFQPTVFDLTQLVEELRPAIEERLADDVTLETVLPSEAIYVKADRGQTEQAILSLAENAGDAMPTGGRFTIVATGIEVGEAQSDEEGLPSPGAYGLLRISDTGIGMDTATRERIFEPFFTTKDRSSGTGMDLAAVYGSVRQAGGHISVSSEPGHGTLFKIHLPVVELAVQPRHSGAGQKTVLVVEPDLALRELIQEELESEDFTVQTAEDGEKALQICEGYDGSIDLLLTVIRMTGMDGVSLARRAAELRPNLGVLFTSGYTPEALAASGIILDAGAKIIEKPFVLDDLVLRIRESIDDA